MHLPLRRHASLLLLIALAGLPAGSSLLAQETHALADVVVVVDTSTSMREPGMDPERTSLLVTKLLSDIVPGELAAVRLLDLVADGELLPRKSTGKSGPCLEDPSRQCEVVEPASDWEADARREKFGALVRPARGDGAYKRALENHLEQRSHNSPFSLAFRAAQGVFAGHHTAAAGDVRVPRTVIWLSDGRDENPVRLEEAIRDVKAEGVAIEAIVFGRGDPRLAREAGLEVHQTSTPAELMKAFAGAFRRVVQAPYEVDALVSAAPSFEVQPQVDEAWVVVYGDDTLGPVRLTGPAAGVLADYASDRWPGAGAYRVAYLERPAPGTWTVAAAGGGPGVAYAVVQWSALSPVILKPRRALSGAPVLLVTGVQAGGQGSLIAAPAVLRELTLTAEVQGNLATLRDDGTGGDEQAGDGKFSTRITFRGTGAVPVRVRLESPLVDRSVEAQVEVSGEFRYAGGTLDVDLGRLGAGEESCRPLAFQTEQRGEVPFELHVLRGLPPGLGLEVRAAAGVLRPGGDPVVLAPDAHPEVCLVASPHAPSSVTRSQPWLELAMAGSAEAGHRVPVSLSWEVAGLSFWQRWGWLILTILAVLALLFAVAGFVLPHRFPGTLALTFVPDRGELDEQSPQPIQQWQGVRIGFYRNARAFLHGDFRLSGTPQGALASLHAESQGARVVPGKGAGLARETLEGGWEEVPAAGRKVRAGDVFRVGDRGPYFRIAVHRGRG
jgi:hypothetical protein